jgi:hypothetical protein
MVVLICFIIITVFLSFSIRRYDGSLRQANDKIKDWENSRVWCFSEELNKIQGAELRKGNSENISLCAKTRYDGQKIRIFFSSDKPLIYSIRAFSTSAYRWMDPKVKRKDYWKTCPALENPPPVMNWTRVIDMDGYFLYYYAVAELPPNVEKASVSITIQNYVPVDIIKAKKDK